ncbi:MAG: VIT1/CCC1 transporter family protein [Candidatus Omnitrophica bacterium]|nr:VIT1/CCC1 transporter family protein [Candidatus Omnitrophota bacterium]
MKKENVDKKIIQAQKSEITEYTIYKNLAKVTIDENNRQVLNNIAEEEFKHYNFWKKFTGKSFAENKIKVIIYVLISRFLGLSFGLKLMESSEDFAQNEYAKLEDFYPEVSEVIKDEEKHELALLDMINEERLVYVSSVVLGLNDALVELTGALAGFTLALQNPRLIAIVGAITGIAASMSMAASEYLSTKHEDTGKSPLKASIYTGLTYFFTVIVLICPYLIFSNVFLSLAVMMINALLIVLIFTFYVSVAKGLNFKKRFLEMAGLSLSIAIINFFIGLGIRKFFKVDI